MSYDDLNVDKEFMDQLFAGDGEDSVQSDAETDALLDELLKEAEEADKNNETDDLFANLGEEKTDAKIDDTAAGPESEEPKEKEEVLPEDKGQEAVEDIKVENEEAGTVTEEVKEENLEGKSGKQEETEASLGMPKFEQNSENDPVRKEALEKMESERQTGNITTITSGTTIRGGIESEGSLEVMGVITGDVVCEGKVTIIGQVTGDVLASEIYVSTERRLVGSLSSKGAIKIGVGTVVIGDIMGDAESTSAYIAGAVKGDIDVNGHVEVDATAIICGNIKAKSIQVNSGAVVEGNMSLGYAGVDLEGFFDEN